MVYSEIVIAASLFKRLIRETRRLKLVFLISLIFLLSVAFYLSWSTEPETNPTGPISEQRSGPTIARLTKLFNILTEKQKSQERFLKNLNISMDRVDKRSIGVLRHELLSNPKALNSFLINLQRISKEQMKIEPRNQSTGFNDIRKFAIVTAANEEFIRSLNKHLPNTKKVFADHPLVVYDLGLSPKSVSELRSQNIQIERFPFELLPEHFKNLKNYAWKPVVIHLALQKFGPDILYGDTSLFYHENIEWDAIVSDNYKGRGIAARELPGHFVNCFTDLAMFEWFQESPENFKQNYIVEAGFVLISDVPLAHLILLTWIQCTLDPKCILPTNRLPYCVLKGINRGHRFDQSAFSMILTYFFVPTITKQKFFNYGPYDMLSSLQYPVATVLRV